MERLIRSVGYTNDTVPSGFHFDSRAGNMFLDLDRSENSSFYKIKYFGQYLFNYFSRLQDSNPIEKDHAERLPLGLTVVVFVKSLSFTIDELKLDNFHTKYFFF